MSYKRKPIEREPLPWPGLTYVLENGLPGYPPPVVRAPWWQQATKQDETLEEAV